MRSGVLRLPRSRRWLRRHVQVVAQPGRRTAVLTPRTTTPQLTLSVRRHPDVARVTVEPVP